MEFKMMLDIHEDAPPHEKEIYIIVVKKAFIHKSADGLTIWNVLNEDFPVGYITPDSPVLNIIQRTANNDQKQNAKYNGKR